MYRKTFSYSALVFGCGLITTVGIAGCANSEWKEVPDRPPIEKVVFFKRRVTVYPSQGTDWRTLVNMQIFGDFWPGITISEAKARFGEPDEIGQNSLGPYYAYGRPGGELHVAWEEHWSGDTAFKIWTLTAYPEPGDAAKLLNPAVLKHLDLNADFTELTVMNGDPVAQILLEDGRVKSITWLNVINTRKRRA